MVWNLNSQEGGKTFPCWSMPLPLTAALRGTVSSISFGGREWRKRNRGESPLAYPRRRTDPSHLNHERVDRPLEGFRRVCEHSLSGRSRCSCRWRRVAVV